MVGGATSEGYSGCKGLTNQNGEHEASRSFAFPGARTGSMYRFVLTLFITDVGASTVSNILIQLTKAKLCCDMPRTLKVPTFK